MSNDYISRADAKRLIADIQLGETPKDAPRTVYLSGVHEGLNMAYGAIASMRPADVRPVARGEWTDKRTLEHDGEWYCTACGKGITIYMGPDRKDRYAFCPNCGADMREVKTDV